MPRSRSGLCYLVDREHDVRGMMAVMLQEMQIDVEQFDTIPAMLERNAATRPDLVFVDVTTSSNQVRDMMQMLIAAKVDCSICIVSGLNGLLNEEIRRKWERGGLKVSSVLRKPLRQHAIKRAALSLQEQSGKPKVGAGEVIDQGWFELWYQPRIDLTSNMLAGAEALFRARHPEHGVIPAGELLEGASDAELLNLTTRVLGRAMSDWKSLHKIGIPIEFSINVPVCALKRLSLFSIFWEHGPGSSDWPGITLELSEDEIVPNMPFAFGAIKELHKQKIKLAIDSFGLSFEELSRLQELPFSEIKIDRSFIYNCDRNPHNAGLCETIIDFAHRYRARVVAEGVETTRELKALRDMNCDYAQGYLFARPMSRSDFITLLQQRTQKTAKRIA